MFRPLKVVVRDGESLQKAVRRLNRIAKDAGVHLGPIYTPAHKKRQKVYYEKPGAKRRRKRVLAKAKRRQMHWLNQ